jgi:2-polyprenyl-3-methyl-5-hydroxy-6-metoxy-1,4-benzoquinol methylase
MESLPYTGERVVPEIMNPRNGLLMEHIARYEFAAGLTRGRVLDLGCGAGYGTEIILDLADPDTVSEVVGIDISDESILYARDMYGYRKAHFDVADIRHPALPERYGLFDTIICFETIEHLEEDEAVVQNIARMLKPDGLLIISTPFGRGKGEPCAAPFHVHQYKESEFIELLTPDFRVDMFVQRDEVIEKRRNGVNYYLMVACCRPK